MNKDKLICFRLDAEAQGRLRKASKETGMSVSDLIRMCVRAELKNLSKRYGSV